jgi:hypothetical protein
MDRNEPDILFKPAARADGFEELMALIEFLMPCAVVRTALAGSGLTGE